MMKLIGKLIESVKYILCAIVVICSCGVPFKTQAAIHAGVRDTGNAGDKFAMDFVEHSVKAVEALRRGMSDVLSDENITAIQGLLGKVIVRSEPHVFVYDPVLNRDIETDVKNLVINGERRIIVSRSLWPGGVDGGPKTPEDKMAIALHEYAGFLGIEVNTHYTSSRFHSQIQALANLTPVLIKEIKAGWREGMDESEARGICREYQKAFEARYFYVYCDFDIHAWREQFKQGRHRNQNGHSQDRHHGHNVEYHDVIRDLTWGIKVFALGRLDQLPFKVIKRSDQLSVGNPVLFDTDIEAKSACFDSLSTALNSRSDESWKYERAQCRSVEVKDQSGNGFFRYEIRTQNPYVFLN
jgi:hypothetical protein